MTDILRLPGHIDSNAAPPLTAQIMEKAGSPVVLDGSGVTFVGALGLQVLVAAKKQWDMDGQAFVLDPVSSDLSSACVCLGVPLDAIGSRQTPQPEELAV